MSEEKFSRVLPEGTAYADASYGLVRTATRIERLFGIEVVSESLTKDEDGTLSWFLVAEVDDDETRKLVGAHIKNVSI